MLSDTSEEQTLVAEGNSSQPHYAPGGGKLLFVSAHRTGHVQPQVYEKNLTTGEERRLTFQNGTTLTPKYHPTEPWIVYASTTDELKENSPLLNPLVEVSKLPPHFQQPTEIYIHSLDGLEITRVTDRLGFDGDAQFSADGRQLLWTRAMKDRTQVVALHRLNKHLQVVSNLGVNPTNYVASSDRKAVAWIEYDQTFGVARLVFKESKLAAIEINGEHIVTKSDLAFAPDNQFLTWSQQNAMTQRFEIWIYSLADKCAHMVVGSDAADRRHPVFSPDMKALTFTLIRGERSRIVSLPWTKPTGPCSSASEALFLGP